MFHHMHYVSALLVTFFVRSDHKKIRRSTRACLTTVSLWVSVSVSCVHIDLSCYNNSSCHVWSSFACRFERCNLFFCLLFTFDSHTIYSM